MKPAPLRVVVVGAGWAGLAAAVELSRAGLRPTLIEAAARPGGRARRVDVHGLRCDNGQHLMMGAYRTLRELLECVGVPETQLFDRRPLSLEMRTPRHAVRLRFPPLPAPWHVIAGFLTARGLTHADRYRALRLCIDVSRTGFTLARDEALDAWLRHAGQSDRLIASLWEPLCLAALNTPIATASARVFLRVLKEVFGGVRSDSDMLFPRVDLGAVFPEPALRYLADRGADLRFGERVTAIDLDGNRIRGLVTRGGHVPADQVILAASPESCLRLIAAHPALAGVARRLSALRHEPICTVYLQYPPDVRLGTEMVGLLEATAQWVLDLRGAGQPGRMAAVISGPGPHMGWRHADLIERVRGELAAHFPEWPPPLRAWTIREKRATFSCRAGIDELRPAAETPLGGLWLAGDYTDTGLPATLEGALRSGRRAAAAVLGKGR